MFFATHHNRMLHGFYVRREKGFKICEINTYAVKCNLGHQGRLWELRRPHSECESGAVMREKIAYVRVARVQLPARHERPRAGLDAQCCQMFEVHQRRQKMLRSNLMYVCLTIWHPYIRNRSCTLSQLCTSSIHVVTWVASKMVRIV